MPTPITLDGHSLSIADVVAVARHAAPVAIAPQALVSVGASRRAVESAVARGDTIYGVNTGFGKLAHVRIKPDQVRELQLNLIRSHASGVGEPLPVDAVRAMMLLRANVLLRGTSGVRAILPELIVAMLNAQVHPRVPAQGSVGASGDLAPLAHLALVMIGEGEGEGEDGPALRARRLEPITLEAKEGLAFVNGTQAQTGLAALLVHDAWVLWRTAPAAAAMSLEAVRRAPARADREPRPVVRAARLPGPGSRSRIGVHDRADRRCGACRGMPGAGHAGERAVHPHGGEPGGRRADGYDRRMEGGADSGQRDAHRGDRAAGGGAGARVPATAEAGPRCGPHARRGPRRGAGARQRPSAQR